VEPSVDRGNKNGTALAQAASHAPPAPEEDAAHAQQVVRELYERYQQQLQRWRGYRNLAMIMAFVALYLAILFTQVRAGAGAGVCCVRPCAGLP